MGTTADCRFSLKKKHFKPPPPLKEIPEYATKACALIFTDLLLELFYKIMTFIDFLHNFWDFFLITIQGIQERFVWDGKKPDFS